MSNDYLRDLHLAKTPEDVPVTAHWAILIFDKINTSDGYGGFYDEACTRYYVFTDVTQWKWALGGMEQDKTYYRKPFVGLVVSAKAKLTTQVSIE